MAVLLGFLSVAGAIFGGEIFTLGERFIAFILGLICLWAGLYFSKG